MQTQTNKSAVRQSGFSLSFFFVFVAQQSLEWYFLLCRPTNWKPRLFETHSTLSGMRRSPTVGSPRRTCTERLWGKRLPQTRLFLSSLFPALLGSKTLPDLTHAYKRPLIVWLSHWVFCHQLKALSVVRYLCWSFHPLPSVTLLILVSVLPTKIRKDLPFFSLYFFPSASLLFVFQSCSDRLRSDEAPPGVLISLTPPLEVTRAANCLWLWLKLLRWHTWELDVNRIDGLPLQGH